MEKLPLLAMGIVSSIVTMQTAPAGSMGSLELLPVSLRIENAVVSYAKYLGKMFWPVDLAALYPLQRSIPMWQVAVSLAVLALISFVVVRQARRRPYLAVGWVWYLATLGPVIGLTQSGDQALADRFMYVPSIGLSIMVAWGLPDLLAKWPARDIALRATAVLTLAGCAMVSRHQVGYWANSYVLWQHALDVTSNNHRAENNFANELMEQGRLDEALRHYEAAERLEPVFADAHNGRGSVLAAKGKVDEAVAEYREALRLKPDHAQTHNNLGNTYYTGGQYDNAFKEYAEAARLAPEMPEAHNGLGAVYAAKGDAAGAIREFEISLRLKPDADVFYNVATMHVQAGRTAEARTALQRALAINPQHADAKRLLATLR
jgi:tetratricopeptide (TPR) repeat protein